MPLRAYDSDAPFAERINRPLPAPVRVDIVHLTHVGKEKVQSVQLPVMRIEGNRVGAFQMGQDRYSVSASPAFGNAITVKVTYAVLDPHTLQYRTVTSPSVTLKSGKMASISSGRDEFRIKADWVPTGPTQALNYTGTLR
jgi:hypothetical protein